MSEEIEKTLEDGKAGRQDEVVGPARRLGLGGAVRSMRASRRGEVTRVANANSRQGNETPSEHGDLAFSQR